MLVKIALIHGELRIPSVRRHPLLIVEEWIKYLMAELVQAHLSCLQIIENLVVKRPEWVEDSLVVLSRSLGHYVFE